MPREEIQSELEARDPFPLQPDLDMVACIESRKVAWTAVANTEKPQLGGAGGANPWA